MTGWRLGWAIGPQDLMGHMGNLALCMLYGSPGFVQDAGIVAIEQDHAEVPQMLTALRLRRDNLHRRLAQVPKLSVELPEAGMFLMIDISRTGLSASDFAFGLLDAERVSVLPGAAFGPQVANYVRINFGAPDSDLDQAGRRIGPRPSLWFQDKLTRETLRHREVADSWFDRLTMSLTSSWACRG
jgi:arginine:pyruvate transaminase